MPPVWSISRRSSPSVADVATAGAPDRGADLRRYGVVTFGYWSFTITDGALRSLVLLHFNELGYSPVEIAFLFLAYEAMGILTNLFGGWIGTRTGLHRTLLAGLALQITALGLLTLPDETWAVAWSVAFVTGVQALSGVAKDLTKMSSKAAVKLVAGEGQGTLFRWVAALTGSKNALKGVGFFVGGALLAWVGYDRALLVMAAALVVALGLVILLLDGGLGVANRSASLTSALSPSTAVNRLSIARVFLFASRDVWFVVAVPIFLADELGWSHTGIGAFLAAWVIGYGLVQTMAPRLVGDDHIAAAQHWALALGVVALLISGAVVADVAVTAAVIGGLAVFGLIFAVNSSVHSYLILAFARSDEDVALDVGFYYSANATGRLLGTLVSGLSYLAGGLPAALSVTALCCAITWLLSLRLVDTDDATTAMATS